MQLTATTQVREDGVKSDQILLFLKVRPIEFAGSLDTEMKAKENEERLSSWRSKWLDSAIVDGDAES